MKKNNKSPMKTLQLNTTRIRRLTAGQLGAAIGGLRDMSSKVTQAGSCVSACWCETDDC